MSELEVLRAEFDQRVETLEEVSDALVQLMDRFPLDAQIIRWQFSDAGRLQECGMNHCIRIAENVSKPNTPENIQIAGYQEIRATYDRMIGLQQRVLQAMRDLCLGDNN